jgi:hypothetical protein
MTSWQTLSLVYQRCQYDELWRCLVKPTDMFLFPFLFSFIIITGFVTMVARRVPLLEQVLSCVRVAWSLVFCVVLCRSLFLIFPLSCRLLLPFTASDYQFGYLQTLLQDWRGCISRNTDRREEQILHTLWLYQIHNIRITSM